MKRAPQEIVDGLIQLLTDARDSGVRLVGDVGGNATPEFHLSWWEDDWPHAMQDKRQTATNRRVVTTGKGWKVEEK